MRTLPLPVPVTPGSPSRLPPAPSALPPSSRSSSRNRQPVLNSDRSFPMSRHTEPCAVTRGDVAGRLQQAEGWAAAHPAGAGGRVAGAGGTTPELLAAPPPVPSVRQRCWGDLAAPGSRGGGGYCRQPG
ncbi:hypothetical protein Agub_g8178 [Astrephomene gubernaculifera]|uniref:Uncharacterized protein n=1 Tax=Astrephomene gubernaculifera TaxID=47775 RepID=A0AAD3HM84_9CHLO|nr:hypothetical protein Agub_g8178 [Astrephomene gubernaculifera]